MVIVFERIAALTYEVKLAIEIESRAEQQRQFAATNNSDIRIKMANDEKPFHSIFHRVIKTINEQENELKHVQANKAGKVITQGYII